MIVGVCGGRNYGVVRSPQFASIAQQERDRVYEVLDRIHELVKITEIVTGAAPGADSVALAWALSREINFRGFPARWHGDGYPQAGPLRNRRMYDATRAPIWVAFPGGRGTKGMTEIAERGGSQVIIVPPMGSWVWPTLTPPTRTSNDPMLCDHANEAPNYCPCEPGCYCKTRTCARSGVVHVKGRGRAGVTYET